MERKHLLILGAVVLIVGAGAFIYNYYLVETGDLVIEGPSANFEFNYNENNNTVVVTHQAGDDFRKSNTKALEVYVFPKNETIPSSPTRRVELPFTEGEQFILRDVSDNEKVVIIWHGDSTSNRLEEYSIKPDQDN